MIFADKRLLFRRKTLCATMGDGADEPDVPVDPTPPEQKPLLFTYGVSAPLPDIYDVYTDELQQQYPFALVYFAIMGVHVLCVSTSPWYSNGEPHMDGDEQLGETIKNDSPCMYFRADGFNADPWEEYTLSKPPELGQSQGLDESDHYEGIGLAVWANHTIMSADGKTILVDKSEPVPVYE